MQTTLKLILAAPEQDANLFWATRFLAPDPVIYVEKGKKKFLILSDLEVDRGRSESQVDQVLSYSELEKKFFKNQKVRSLDVVAAFLKDLGGNTIEVPTSFPLGAAEYLKKKGLKLQVKPDPFYEGRLVKTNEEKQAIRQSLKWASEAIQAAYQVLGESKIEKNKLIWNGKTLTSEILRGVINGQLMRRNCLGKHTIVACGEQGVDPHCGGYGPLKPHQPIIMDVFPQSMDTQYFGDMTRTVVKGKASEKIRKQWQTVKYAQATSIKKVKDGVDGQSIHDWILEYFETQGYKTGIQDGRMQGFFHGTGHGLGLEIHEAPRISKVKNILKAGHVVTVEPGLYFSGVGGVRIEDVVFVTKTGCEVLSKCPKILEIE